MFLEEFKYVVEEKKMLEYITNHIEISSDDSDRDDSDEENSDEEISDEENFSEETKYRMCLVFIFLMSQMKKVIIFKAFWVTITHIPYIIFKGYKKIKKTFFIIFFFYI